MSERNEAMTETESKGVMLARHDDGEVLVVDGIGGGTSLGVPTGPDAVVAMVTAYIRSIAGDIAEELVSELYDEFGEDDDDEW